jgi:hypothetical protein
MITIEKIAPGYYAVMKDGKRIDTISKVTEGPIFDSGKNYVSNNEVYKTLKQAKADLLAKYSEEN